MERKKSKIFLFLLLQLELFSSRQLRAELTTTKETSIAGANEPPNSFNDRLSKIESENHQQKQEISLLKTKVNEDKKAIDHLTTSLEVQKMVVNQLNGRITKLETLYANHSTIIYNKVTLIIHNLFKLVFN